MIQTIAYRLKTSNKNVHFTGTDRLQYLDNVWDMYQKTYARIGLMINSKHDLLADYDTWHLILNNHEIPIQFHLFKRTSYGYKSGLAGCDMTSEGKSAQIHDLSEKYHKKGFYGEVSHKVRDIAVSSRAPVICSSFAHKILGKNVDIVGALEYSRNISGIGNVTKIIVGNPVGIPTTDYEHPSCPIIASQMEILSGVDDIVDDICDIHAHYASMNLSNLLSSSPISL
jgi:hypothetical protein